MADIYLKPTGSDAADGLTWANAKLTLSAAITAAGADGSIWVDNTFNEVNTASKTYTLLSGQRILSTSDTTNMPPMSLAAGAKLSLAGAAAANQQLRTASTGAADKPCLFSGITFEVGTGNTATPSMRFTGHQYENCTFSRLMTSTIIFDNQRTKGCTFSNAAGVTSNITLGNNAGHINSSDDVYFPSGGVPSPLLAATTGFASFDGCDLSAVQYISNTSSAPLKLLMQNCKMHPSFAIQAAIYNDHPDQTIIDCDSGDNHYKFIHADRYGTLQVVTSKYITSDGATYDGTNRESWVIVGTSYCKRWKPYKSPWIDVYTAGGAALNPYLEILRTGTSASDANPFTNAEVWVEFEYKGTSGSTRVSFADDSAGTLGTPANQAAGVGTGSWTGLSTYSWSGKLALPSSITPLEIGSLRARVCVASGITVYVDPKIRGI